MIFLSRLRWVLAVAGMVFALAGIALSNSVVIWAAIGILAVALLLGLVLRKRRDQTLAD